MGNNEILNRFENEIELRKESASYLFYGDKRVDLLSYALEFSKIVMTKDMVDPLEIKREKTLIDRLQHPDIEVINQHNENIKIDEVREIIFSSVESTFNSRKKIFILCGIENLRKESSNALLKILEEPPKDVYFILLSRSLNIIPTIKSRTIKFHLKSPSNEDLGVSKEIYYFFGGDEKDIKEFKEKGIALEEYENRVETIDDVLYYFIEMKKFLSSKKNGENEGNKIENSLNLVVGYNKSIDFLCKKIRFFDTEEVYFLINEIIEEFKDEKEILLDLLSKIVVNSRNILDSEELKKLINLKNSIRNNVNIRSILFNFFDICANG